MNVSSRIELAHEPDFILGRLTVSPSRRELVRDDGQREVIEHRVMQVLIALSKAEGGIVTRDELILLCWGGRVVGEDAINRVISRLRKTADGIGAGSFRIETVTKIGHRLTGEGLASTAPQASAANAKAGGLRPSRRAFAAGAIAAGVLGVAGGALLYRSAKPSEVPPEIEALKAQAWQAWTQGTSEGNNQAIGLYRRVTALAPDHADGWGLLGCAYADRPHGFPGVEAEPLYERARATGQRALELDPRNAYGRAAIAYARPIMGNWLAMERGFRQAIGDQPDKQLVRYGLALSLSRVGRCAEAATLFDQLVGNAPTPSQYYFHIQALWGAGRIEDADRVIGEAAALYATHPMIWFARFETLMFSGRAGTAIALGEDIEGHPSGVGERELQDIMAVARAIRSGDPGSIDAVMAARMRGARESAGNARRAIEHASALGRLDAAFRMADAYFFSRGFAIPDAPSRTGLEGNTALRERQTIFLFLPAMRSMRADPRFDRLVEEIGLERYWRESGIQPDYRRLT